MTEENNRGRTAQQELESLRMSLLRIAQALDTRDKLPGSGIQMQDRDDYGLDEEVQACQCDTGWNALAASCVDMAKDLQADSLEAWRRGKRFFVQSQAYEQGSEELNKVSKVLASTLQHVDALCLKVRANEAQLATLLETPEGQVIQKLLGQQSRSPR